MEITILSMPTVSRKAIKLGATYTVNEKGKRTCPTEERMENLFAELVPSYGAAETFLGEVVRAWTRLMYRLWNDGDVPYYGYGRETCGPSMKWLNSMLPISVPRYSYKTGEERLINYATKVLAYFDAHPELANLPTPSESR